MCILHFVPACHKKKNDGCAASAAWRTQSFRRSSIQKSCISMCVQAWNFQFCVWTQKWRERRRGTRRLLAAVCSEDTHENVRAPVTDRLYFFVCAWKKKKGWFWITSSLSFYQISRREQLLCLLFFSFALCCFKINCCLDDFRWYEQAHVVRFSLAMSLTWRMYFVKQSHALCLQFCMHQIMLCAASTCVESRCDFWFDSHLTCCKQIKWFWYLLRSCLGVGWSQQKTSERPDCNQIGDYARLRAFIVL